MNNSINNELMVFENEEFGNIRTIKIDETPWFVGRDIAVALGYVNPKKALADHVDEEDKIKGAQNATPSVIDSLGRKQYPTWINQSGMYSLILSSKLPSAKRFKRWVTSEVLPALLKTSSYETPKTKANAQGNQSSGIDAAREIFSFIDSVVNQGKKSDESKSIMNEAMFFKDDESGFSVRTMLNPDGSIFINAEDTAIGFGWTQTQNKNGKQYTSIRWETLNGYCKDFGFPNKLGKDDYLPESLFYRLAMKANNATAEKFQNWLAIDVIPQIRKTGSDDMPSKANKEAEALKPQPQAETQTVQGGFANGLAQDLQIFNNEEFGQVRMIELNGKPYFVGIDIATALGYANPSKAVIQHCKGITKMGIPSKGGIQETNCIPEGDMYRLITHSELPSAERFEKWVFDEILPTLRKTGSYGAQKQEEKISESQNKFYDAAVFNFLPMFAQMDPQSRQDTLNLLKLTQNATIQSAFAPEKQPLQANSEGNYGENPVENPNFRSQAMSEARKVCEKLGYGTNYKKGLSTIYREMKHMGVNWGTVKTKYIKNGGKNFSPSCMEQISLLPEYQSIFFEASKRLA